MLISIFPRQKDTRVAESLIFLASILFVISRSRVQVTSLAPSPHHSGVGFFFANRSGNARFPGAFVLKDAEKEKPHFPCLLGIRSTTFLKTHFLTHTGKIPASNA